MIVSFASDVHFPFFFLSLFQFPRSRCGRKRRRKKKIFSCGPKRKSLLHSHLLVQDSNSIPFRQKAVTRFVHLLQEEMVAHPPINEPPSPDMPLSPLPPPQLSRALLAPSPAFARRTGPPRQRNRQKVHTDCAHACVHQKKKII